MTPFGEKVRELRRQRGLSLKQMAADIGLSAAYLSALEHGHRGRPPFALVQQICAYFRIIWDEAEELQRLAKLSHPRVVIDTAGLSPKATEVANRLAQSINKLNDSTLGKIEALLKR
jgi:transcriptional regulator with XRE-family HTH domain